MARRLRGRRLYTWPLMATLLIWSVTLVFLMVTALRETGGRLIYGLDDAYIHMAVAKHLVQDGVWGVTPYSFSSSSSSILWPLLLSAGFELFGINQVLPLAFAIAASYLLIILVFRWLKKLGAGTGWTFVILLSLLYFTPLPPLMLDGMEHILQVLLALGFAETLLRLLSRPNTKQFILLAVLACLLASVRYEGLFLAFVGAGMLLVRRQLRMALGVVLAAAFPVLIYGAISVRNGWLLLPNSLLLKHAPTSLSSVSGLMSLVSRPFGVISDTGALKVPQWQVLAIVSLFLVLMLDRRKEIHDYWDRRVTGTVFFVGVALVHSALVGVEWFFRYGAYVNALGIFAIGLLVSSPPGVHLTWPAIRSGMVTVATAMGCVALFLPLVRNSSYALLNTPTASRNIYEMQYQMGAFLGEYYASKPVAVNDLGAVDFFADLHTVDLFGLASPQVAESKLEGHWDANVIGSIVTRSGAQVAVVFDSWFKDTGLPGSWVRVEEWKIADNVASGSDTVSWYSTDPQSAQELAHNLSSFRAELPRDVTVQVLPLP
ncbi:MAG: hypothetical protein ABSF61_01125 [Anaerolineales bacterium]